VKNNYKYSKYTELIFGEVGWKCIQKTCSARLYTIGVDYKFSQESGTHLHESIDTNIIIRQKISNGIKRNGLDNITDRPSKLIKLELANNVEATSTLTCKDTKSIRDNISRERIRNLPKLPKSISEVHEYINNTKPITVKDEYFFITNEPIDHIYNNIFMCFKFKFKLTTMFIVNCLYYYYFYTFYIDLI